MKIKEFIKSLGLSGGYSGIKDFQVKGISCNSREQLKDFVFVAVRGARQDGSRFIKEAVAKGAGAVVTEDPRLKGRCLNGVPLIFVKDTRQALAKLAACFYGHPSSRVRVVGITGTNGKTTITYLLEAVAKKAGFSCGVIGTVNYRYKNTIITATNTTPGPIQLQSLLAKMRKAEVRYCFMEVSSHALDQDRAGEIDFRSAIFTNLTQDHLDYHKTRQRYFLAKAKLFAGLGPGASAVINNDDAYAGRLKFLTPARVVTYGIKKDADFRACGIKFFCHRTEFRLCGPGRETDFSMRLIGRHNVYNALAVIAWAHAEGIKLSDIRSAIESFSHVPGRLEKINFSKGFSVFVDYAHTEDALKNVISSLRDLTKKNIIVVFGCGGERDKTKRPKMGRVVSELADYAIVTSDNPRSENPGDIISDIKRGINKNNYCVIPQRKAAIKKSLVLAEPGDIVLVAGKGHETCQILGNRTIHFDDREVVKECLRSMN